MTSETEFPDFEDYAELDELLPLPFDFDDIFETSDDAFLALYHNQHESGFVISKLRSSKRPDQSFSYKVDVICSRGGEWREWAQKGTKRRKYETSLYKI
ncbi:hypothetical protein H9Q73_001636 [Fusarium xylarioides]|nr:hypothetical protein H9Q73_001636 [Fusarium xylarioides]